MSVDMYYAHGMMYACACRGQKLTPCLVDHSQLINRTSLASQLAQGTLLDFLSSCIGITGMPLHLSDSYVGSGDLNSAPHFFVQ